MIFLTGQQIRRYYEAASLEYGIDGLVMMENAGGAAAGIVAEDIRAAPGSVAVVAGPGNNAGVGFVAARHLVNGGRRARVFFTGQRDMLPGEARRNFEVLVKMGVGVTNMPRDGDVEQLSQYLRGRAAVVDALFGTGLDREVSGRYRTAVDLINGSGAVVLSLDLPSGLDADTGHPRGACVRARKTVTFGCMKRGLVVHPGAGLAGEIVVAGLGASEGVIEKSGYDGEVIEESVLGGWLQPRAEQEGERAAGRVLVVAGAGRGPGGAVLAALGLLRTGSSSVTVAAPADEAGMIGAALPPEASLAAYDAGSAESLAGPAIEKDAVVLAPGLASGRAHGSVVEFCLEHVKAPLVVDAGDLASLGLKIEEIESREDPLILTGSPRDLVRMSGGALDEFFTYRIPVLRELAGRSGAHILLLEGRITITGPDGRVFVSRAGDAAGAGRGAREVLAGLVGSFCGQGFAPVEAACLASYVHGMAAEKALAKKGEPGMKASDTIEEAPLVLVDLMRQLPGKGGLK